MSQGLRLGLAVMGVGVLSLGYAGFKWWANTLLARQGAPRRLVSFGTFDAILSAILGILLLGVGLAVLAVLLVLGR